MTDHGHSSESPAAAPPPTEHAHPGAREYLAIAVVLTVITAVEVAVFYIPSMKPALRQGVIETSNVNSISAVVTLIGVQRQAEMLQRAMTLFDNEFNRIASTDLARV